MIARVRRFALGVTLLVVLAPAAATQTQSAPSVPDLSGFWINQYTPDLSRVLGKQPPFTPQGADRWRNVDTANDPTGRCWPPGPTRAFTAPYPFVLVQHSNTVAILFEYFTIWRVVYLDGRPHPANIADNPEFMGHSIGHWEGSTLVVDTVGIDDRSWLDTAGHEHSDKLHVVERFEKQGANIHWTATFEDSEFFARPWSVARTFTPGKANDRILSYSCTENNRDIGHLRPNQPNLNFRYEPDGTAR